MSPDRREKLVEHLLTMKPAIEVHGIFTTTDTVVEVTWDELCRIAAWNNATDYIPCAFTCKCVLTLVELNPADTKTYWSVVYNGIRLGWDLGGALAYIRELQPKTMAVGWCILLGGSVLNKGYSANDLDLLAYPRTLSSDREKLFELLPSGEWSEWSGEPVSEVFSFQVDGRKVDLIFWPRCLIGVGKSLKKGNDA